jgi:hypothetical protein
VPNPQVASPDELDVATAGQHYADFARIRFYLYIIAEETLF